MSELEFISLDSFTWGASTGLRIGQPLAWYHITRTFPQKCHCLEEARRHLKRWLDRVLKALERQGYRKPFCFFAPERHKREKIGDELVKGGWHWHGFFCWYEDESGKLVPTLDFFRTMTFNAWNKLHHGRCSKDANWTTTHHQIDPSYFFKRLKVLDRGKERPRGKVHWWIHRNMDVLDKHGAPLDRTELKRIIHAHRHGDRWYWNGYSQETDKHRNKVGLRCVRVRRQPWGTGRFFWFALWIPLHADLGIVQGAVWSGKYLISLPGLAHPTVIEHADDSSSRSLTADSPSEDDEWISLLSLLDEPGQEDQIPKPNETQTLSLLTTLLPSML